MSADRLPESPWLSRAEVEELTERQRFKAQCRVLAEMGVPFQPNAIGRPLVPRQAVLPSTAPAKGKRGPDWSAMKSKAA